MLPGTPNVDCQILSARPLGNPGGIDIASREPDGQPCPDGTRRNRSAQGAQTHYQYLHIEAFEIPAMRPSECGLTP